MERTYKNCQSCSMPLKHSPNGGGTCADGAISTMYCAYCFEKGEFKQADWTVDQMRAFAQQKLREKGFPGFLARFFTRGIPKLERWKSK